AHATTWVQQCASRQVPHVPAKTPWQLGAAPPLPPAAAVVETETEDPPAPVEAVVLTLASVAAVVSVVLVDPVGGGCGRSPRSCSVVQPHQAIVKRTKRPVVRIMFLEERRPQR